MAVRVLVVSDVRLYREGLQQALQGAEGVELVGVASFAEEAVDHTFKLAPAVIVLGLAMSECLSVARRLARACETKAVVLGVPEAEAEVVAGLRAGIDGLTAREKQILRLLMQGLSNKMISRSLGIGLPTAKNHVHNIFAKLGVHGRAQAISVLYRQGTSTQSIERGSEPTGPPSNGASGGGD